MPSPRTPKFEQYFIWFRRGRGKVLTKSHQQAEDNADIEEFEVDEQLEKAINKCSQINVSCDGYGHSVKINDFDTQGEET